MRSSRGIAIVIVLLVTAVALMAAVGAATISTLTSMESASSERRANAAQFAAESGLNSLVARSRAPEYEFLSTDSSVAQWLARVGLRSYTLPGGSTVNLSVLYEDSSRVTMRAEGIAANGSRRVVLQDYELGVDNSVPGLFANAALVTQGDFHSNSAQSTIIGRDSSPASWIFTNRQIWEALEGEYFTTSHACGGGQVTFKVTDSAANPAADGMIDVAAIPVGTCPGVTALAANTMGTLLPFAVASSVDSMGRPVGTAFRQTIQVTDTSLYAPRNEIFIANGTATIEDVGVGTIDISWDVLPTGPVAEATPIRQHIPSVIAEGSHGGTDCPSESNSKFPQGCFFADLSNIWEKTFPGISMGEMLDLAQDNNAHYGPTAGTQGDWPTGPVSGVTWIDGAQTGDFNSGGSGGGGNGKGNGKGNGGGGSATSGGALCGEGIVILNTGVFGTNAANTSINLNVSGCEFKGVLYVIGDLGIQGNLESFSGTIIVETGVGTRVQGNGEKSFYDPVAIRRALAQLPPPAGKPGFVGAIPSTWRFGE